MQAPWPQVHGQQDDGGLAQHKTTNEVAIPVLAELDRDIIRNIGGSGEADDPSRTLNALVAKGLRAELAMQSLLTNQLHVDLDFQPERQARRLVDGHGTPAHPAPAHPSPTPVGLPGLGDGRHPGPRRLQQLAARPARPAAQRPGCRLVATMRTLLQTLALQLSLAG